MENNENMVEETKDKEVCQCNCKKCCCMIAIMTFLGSFLAFYFLMHQSMIHFFRQHHKYDLIRYEENLENDFENDINKLKSQSGKEFQKLKNSFSSVQTSKYEDAYVIMIDLKPFNNDEGNIKFNYSDNIVTITGNTVKSKKNGENSYYFTESYEIPDKIISDKITKERIKDKYIITLPIEE